MTLEHDLAELREPAPAGIMPAVLARTGLADQYVVRPSPLGPLFVTFGSDGIRSIDLADDPDAFVARYETRTGRRLVPAENAPVALERLDKAIAEGRPGRLDVDLSGLTAFQQAVLRKATEIPPGEVRPYGWIAAEIGSPGATRAVGSALARNPVPVIVPCHRVVRTDGRIGEYSLGGPENKRALLGAEGLDAADLEALAARGIRYIGSDTTKIACHPTCGAAHRITDPHRVEFRSASDAVGAGYRACKLCRPKLVTAA
jgi:O-6-methylguanine DNA methyltransferase